MATARCWHVGAWRCVSRARNPSSSKAALVRLASSLRVAPMAEQRGLVLDKHLKCRALATHPGNSPANQSFPDKERCALVSGDWLHQKLGDPHIKVLDASWYMPAEQRNPKQEFINNHIPGALFLDIDGIVDLTVDLPHMLPSETSFAGAMSALGLRNSDTIVVYDGKGIFSSARVWWMFRVFGHEKVCVLNGGLPHWRASSYPIESSVSSEILSRIEASVTAVRNPDAVLKKPGVERFKTSFQQHLVWSLEQVARNIDEQTFQHIDARSKARFDGIVNEPRKGIRSGHVPGSKCIPFTEVLNEEGILLSTSELEKKFKEAGLNLEAPIVASCGTGVTACILALALYQLGITSVPVYDGSWTEWGGLSNSRVAVAGSVAS